MMTMTEVIEQNRHARLEHKWLREDIKRATVYSRLFIAGVFIFIIATGIIRVKLGI